MFEKCSSCQGGVKFKNKNKNINACSIKNDDILVFSYTTIPIHLEIKSQYDYILISKISDPTGSRGYLDCLGPILTDSIPGVSPGQRSQFAIFQLFCMIQTVPS